MLTHDHQSTSPIYEACPHCIAKNPDDNRPKEFQPKTIDLDKKQATYRCVECGGTIIKAIPDPPEATFHSVLLDIRNVWR